MAAPTPSVIAATHGYHPLTGDVRGVLEAGSFAEMLVIGSGVPDVVDLVQRVRLVHQSPRELPVGVYWFSGVSPAAVLLVESGATPSSSLAETPENVVRGSALDSALSWLEHLWEQARPVEMPAFAVLDEVLTSGTGQDGVIKGRQYLQGRWMYSVFVGGRTQKMAQDALLAKPLLDDPSAWVTSRPAPADRFAATLTRAKLEGRFTDTVFSFRATRTIFRPYQFKPVMKLLGAGALRMLIADEVGLGKTIEAGLLWTELEARRQADRVLVVCPSSLVGKWQREMEERFGFELVELTKSKLTDLKSRLESGQMPRRAAYVSSIERLRAWPDLAAVTEVGLQFDLVIVDEAHAFRNSDTKSHVLGEYLSQWTEALVMLSATPVNLRNQDLFNLLELLVPGEFLDLLGLEERIAPNAVLNRVVGSLLSTDVSNAQRRMWLKEMAELPFGRILMLRPDFKLLEEVLDQREMTPRDVVKVKRICSELHGLSSQITRTRKVEVDEDKALREPRVVPVIWSESESDFYAGFYQWCVQRAADKAMPLNFAMQMPLRLAGSCLPEAAQLVLAWNRSPSVGTEIDSIAAVHNREIRPDISPSSELVQLARALHVDTKLVRFRSALGELMDLRKQVLVFTFSRRTLDYLQANLADLARVAVLHGGVPREQRDQIMTDFRLGRYDVVVATKVASEGLDFEFCSALVNYDLPWNPMEIEQRIGRIDRIGQQEAKLIVMNFNTPGTIETDIIERVMERIGVFERAIGALEPIINSVWSDVESALLDFTLTPAQREQREKELLAAIEERAQSLEDVESAAPLLISSDGADIEGLEPDLLASGRYVGQMELALLVGDWAQTYGGRISVSGGQLTLVGNDELASHVQTLVRIGQRSSAEVNDLMSSLRNEQPIYLSLDQEASRQGGVALLTANHPLVRAAVGVPGHRQTRFASVAMAARDAGLPPGSYLVLLRVAHWDGVRPLHEVWTSTVDLGTKTTVTGLGEAVMAQLASGQIRGSADHVVEGLTDAVAIASDELLVRQILRSDEQQAENRAFMETRRLSIQQVHDRRVEAIQERIHTLRSKGKGRAVPLFEAQLHRANLRFEAQLHDVDRRGEANMHTEDLAVCLVEVADD